MLISTLKKLASIFGLEIKRYNPSNSHASQLSAMLNYHEIDLVLDVGANVGQFGHELRQQIKYKKRIVSFEPMLKEYQALLKASKNDSQWFVAERSAIGSYNGSIDINISQNSVSSSVLPMLDAHSNAAPESSFISKESVPLLKLDDAVNDHLDNAKNIFLKIDTQGYEKQVLDGAKKTIDRCVGIQLELSLVNLYSDQSTIYELIDYMRDLGFNLWGISPVFADPDSGQMLQVDGTFFRN